MTTQTEAYEDEYEEYDEFDEGDGERGLSGLVVLLMGVVMLGAFASIVWIAYQQGIKSAEGERGATPYVAADPEPLKIENQVADAAGGNDRAVYDRLEDGAASDVEVLAQGPEEPVARDLEDPIAAIASGAGAGSADIIDDAAGDRIASLEAADAALAEVPAAQAPQAGAGAPARAVTTPTPAATEPAPQPAAATASASTGTHLVQVGAFKSQAEADGFWARLETKLGDFVAGKAPDTERADLGDKGVFFRLRIGPFSSADDAKTYCEGLKSRGQDCLVKPK